MTDNDIVKALEYCYGDENYCKRCPYMEEDKCHKVHTRDVLGLIKRQKAEIERLREESKSFADIGKMYSEIKAEAIKEFAEKLKEMAFPDDSICTQMVVEVSDIDDLAKEMVGESDV